MRRRSSMSLLGLATLVVVGLTGCFQKKDVSYTHVLGHLTPEMAGIAETPDDVRSNMAVVGNVNLRLASDDLGRIFLFDQPSTLSPYPIIPTGNDP